MISVPIHNTSGKSAGEYQFDPADLAPGINKQLLHDVVVMYESNKRVGTFRTKSRGEVEGSTKKLFRQKGTGNARMGTIRTPTRRGGGHAFAKRPIDFSYSMPKKAMRLATRMAFLSKFLDKQATVLDVLAIDAPKTKVVADMLRALGLGETSCLLVIDEHDANIWKSSRNIPNLAVSSTSGLNAYDLLHQRQVIVTKSALDRLRAAKAK